MTAEYVRNYYGVPARRFMRVTVDGRPGVITGFDRQYLLVRFDDERGPSGRHRGRPERWHPTWRVEYHEPPMDPERFWSKVDRSGDCWQWRGTRTSGGYGQFRMAGSPDRYAHRVAYQLAKGEIPDGLVLDHLCRNTSCVNPDHLEPVTQRTNVLRGDSPMAHQARQTHCKDGHEFAPENTLIDGRGKRRCRACTEAWNAAYHDRRMELQRARRRAAAKKGDAA